MIKECQDLIIERLETIASVAGVEAWQGDIEALAGKPQRLPALMVIYEGCTFAEKKVIGANQVHAEKSWLVVLLHKDLRGPKAALEGCYGIIEAVRQALIGFEVAPHGHLMPVSEELVFEKNGLYIYGLKYRMTVTVTNS